MSLYIRRFSFQLAFIIYKKFSLNQINNKINVSYFHSLCNFPKVFFSFLTYLPFFLSAAAEGVVNTFIFHNSFSKSMQMLSKKCIHIFPLVYDLMLAHYSDSALPNTNCVNFKLVYSITINCLKIMLRNLWNQDDCSQELVTLLV